MNNANLVDVDINNVMRGYPKNDFLTREEEQRIAKLPEDHEDRWKLVTHNMQFVMSFALKTARKGRIHDGYALIASIQDAMISSSRSFKPLGWRFCSYAIRRMRWAAMDERQLQAAPVRLPRWGKANEHRLRPDGDYYHMLPTGSPESYLADLIDEWGTPTSYNDSPEEVAMRNELIADLRSALSEVENKRDVGVVEEYYAPETPTLAKVGETMGICKERVRQLRERAFDHMRKSKALQDHSRASKES